MVNKPVPRRWITQTRNRKEEQTRSVLSGHLNCKCTTAAQAALMWLAGVTFAPLLHVLLLWYSHQAGGTATVPGYLRGSRSCMGEHTGVYICLFVWVSFAGCNMCVCGGGGHVSSVIGLTAPTAQGAGELTGVRLQRCPLVFPSISSCPPLPSCLLLWWA